MCPALRKHRLQNHSDTRHKPLLIVICHQALWHGSCHLAMTAAQPPLAGFPDPDRLLVALYARGSCSLVATDPDGADRRADVVHDANGPFGFRPETAVQVFQPLAHENHGSIAGRLRARKLGAGMVGPVRPVVEVKKIASHGSGNADAFSIVAQRLSVLLKPAKGL